MTFSDEAVAMRDHLVRVRRSLHSEPEVGLSLPRSQEKVLASLDGLGLEISTGSRLSSVTAVLRGARPGPAVLLRADMDALPVAERTGLSFASTTEGVMHACGHDLHTTMLIGAAHLLAGRRHDLAGDVVLMFQPGEEGWDGAGAMLAEGVLDAAGPRPVAAYALHVFTTGFRHGTFMARSGPTMAATNDVDVTITGVGGHSSAPHRAKDPVPAACEIVTALQTMVTRSCDPFDPVVLTVGSFHAGTRRNVIPETARFEGTVRTFSDKAQSRMKDAVVHLVRQIAAAHGLRAKVEFTKRYPVTVNDAQETAFVEDTVNEGFGEHRFRPLPHPLTGAEDFSRVLNEVPGSLVMLGAAPAGADPEAVSNNHSSYAEFDEGVLGDGAALYADLAARRLALGSTADRTVISPS
ncbi:M20 metallopeptidase family protein [Streptomyces tubercidicus]|uniref:M20 metallopeptidase family protein n=1 Tax=Streptomyces tubercidicus TaxID=47759 RepID=UPI001357D3C8|nr:M20 family metallopeptidase [Streptomyces tubercidicus]WAU15709.1 M20 family metallopeptidase [Streptomyces tubercidicus]